MNSFKAQKEITDIIRLSFCGWAMVSKYLKSKKISNHDILDGLQVHDWYYGDEDPSKVWKILDIYERAYHLQIILFKEEKYFHVYYLIQTHWLKMKQYGIKI